MEYDPLDPQVWKNPYPHYAWLRRHAPVYRIRASGFWAVSRYEDVLFALRHPALFSSSPMAGGGNLLPLSGCELSSEMTLIASDPPAHTRLRRRIDSAFTARRIRALEPLIARTAARLVTRFASRGECDLVADLAAPLTTAVIAELLGIESAQQDEFKTWSKELVRYATGRVSPTERPLVAATLEALVVKLRSSIEARRARPRDDLISVLLHGEDPLVPSQVLNLSMLLVVAGNETTTHLIGNAMLALLQHPGELENVRSNRHLLSGIVEETLRFDSPVQGVLRRASSELKLSDVDIPQNAFVLLLLGSANRDERIFAEGETFRPRADSQQHLAFGAGAHACLGASLARLEARHALAAVLRLPRLCRKEQPIERVESFLLRGLQALHLTFDPS